MPLTTISGEIISQSLNDNFSFLNSQIEVALTAAQTAVLNYNISNVKDFGASGSIQATTGTISAISNQLTLASALDFEDGQGIIIANAGPATSLTAPTGVSATTSGTPGTASYTYSVSAVDAYGGMTIVGSYTITSGNTVQDKTNFNIVTWNLVGSAYVYAVYRSGGTGGNGLINFINGDGNTLYDRNFSTVTTPFNISSTPPASPVMQFLTTTITSGAGTITLVLNDSATTSVTNGAVTHDDTLAIQNALDGAGKVFFPEGTYNVSNRTVGGNFEHCLALYRDTEIYGVHGASIIKALMSYITAWVLINKENIFGTQDDENIYIHDMVIDGGVPDATIHVSSNAVTFNGTALILFAMNAATMPTNMYVENNYFQNGCALGCVFVSIHHGAMVNNFVNNMGRDGLDSFGNCNDILISGNSINQTGDDGIGISTDSGFVTRNIRVIGNNIYNSGSRGINVQGVNHVISNNTISNTAWSGIEVNNNNHGQEVDHIIVNSNIIDGAGIYTGGINGWSADTANGTYGIKMYDYAGVTANQLSNIVVDGNVVLNGTKGVQILGSNATLSIDRVTISNNVFDTNGVISASGTVPPTNIINVHNSGGISEQYGTASLNVTAAGTQANGAVNFPATFGSIPKVFLTINSSVVPLAGYVNAITQSITESSFILSVNAYATATITVNWAAII